MGIGSLCQRRFFIPGFKDLFIKIYFEKKDDNKNLVNMNVPAVRTDFLPALERTNFLTLYYFQLENN
jgi:hypothetical protein